MPKPAEISSPTEFRRFILPVVALFLSAMAVGFKGESTLNPAELVTYQDLMQEMSRVLRTLEPLRPASRKTDPSPTPDGLPEEFTALAEREIVTSLPDGTWGLDKRVTVGEGIYYFHRLFESIWKEMIQTPYAVEAEPSFTDILPGHWLQEPLRRLGSVGALGSFSGPRLNPDSLLRKRMASQLGTSLIGFFGSNILVFTFDGRLAQVTFKGVVRKISGEKWTWSTDGGQWSDLDPAGTLVPEFPKGKATRVFLRHPHFLDVGPLSITKDVPLTTVLRLKLNYSEFASAIRQAMRTTEVPADQESERERIKARLEHIRQSFENRHRGRQPVAPISPPAEQADITDPQPTEEEISPPDSPPPSPPPPPAPPLPPAPAPSRWPAPPSQASSRPVGAPLRSSLTGTQPVRYQGVVRDAVSGAPIPGAMVIVAARQYSCSRNGTFSFEAQPQSLVELMAYCEGYEPLELKHRAGFRPGPLELTLKPSMGSFRGRVVDASTGEPVAKAIVRVGPRATRTAPDGTFALQRLKPGYHQLSCFAAAFMDAHEIVHIGSEQGAEFRLELKTVSMANLSEPAQAGTENGLAPSIEEEVPLE